MKRILLITFLALGFVIKSNAQVSFNITDGSQYLFGNSDVEVWYLYVQGGTNGTYGQEATCRDWSLYITVYNKVAKRFNFYADASVNTSCGGSTIKRAPLQGIISAKESYKYRITFSGADAWMGINDTPGTPGFNFTSTKWQ